MFEVDDAGTQWNPVRKQRVMKVLKCNSPKLVELIERESLCLEIIRHSGIPRSTRDDFFTFLPHNNSLTLYCLVMDKIEGQNLERWLESNSLISQYLALEWLQQLVDILDTVHRYNFFHRDIKPYNIAFPKQLRYTQIFFNKVSSFENIPHQVGKRYKNQSARSSQSSYSTRDTANLQS